MQGVHEYDLHDVGMSTFQNIQLQAIRGERARVLAEEAAMRPPENAVASRAVGLRQRIAEFMGDTGSSAQQDMPSRWHRWAFTGLALVGASTLACFGCRYISRKVG